MWAAVLGQPSTAAHDNTITSLQSSEGEPRSASYPPSDHKDFIYMTLVPQSVYRKDVSDGLHGSQKSRLDDCMKWKTLIDVEIGSPARLPCMEQLDISLSIPLGVAHVLGQSCP